MMANIYWPLPHEEIEVEEGTLWAGLGSATNLAMLSE